ncbi:putative monodehydroascorbate reductase (NADH) [Helianthus anomalus]
MGEEGQVISCHTVDAWNHHIKKDKNKLIVVDFAASWCGPCKVIAPFVAELAKSMPHVTFLKVDVDELKVKKINKKKGVNCNFTSWGSIGTVSPS